MLRIAVQSKAVCLKRQWHYYKRQDIKISTSKRILYYSRLIFRSKFFFFAMMIFLSRWLVEWLI